MQNDYRMATAGNFLSTCLEKLVYTLINNKYLLILIGARIKYDKISYR